MSDIWSVGGSDNEGVDQAGAEEWQCSSGSEEEERPRKRAKQSGKSKTKRPRVGNRRQTGLELCFS